jgi:PhzF family phenazine biosynthesis protein
MNIKIVNVFSSNNQGGNPCAIVDNAIKLSGEEMQSIATRINLPETIYIIPNKNQHLLRFFATKGELPLCCHGILGAAFYLFKLKGAKYINIESYIDNIKVNVEYCDGLISMSIANNGKILETNIDVSIIIAMLAINKGSISKDLPYAIASIGSPKLLVPIINRNTLFNIVPNLDLMTTWCKNHAINGIYAYSNDTINSSASYVGRSFNPLFSHQEDVATGAAAAALGQMLCANSGRLEGAYTIEQGANLGRPSKIFISITPKNIIIKGEAYLSN